MDRQLRVSAIILVSVLCVSLMVPAADCAAVHSRRAVAETGSSVNLSMVKICHSSTPCGWAVYIPFTRRVDYFMKNTCECPQGKACLRSDDDLSVSAYVYRCHVDTTDHGDEEESQVS